MENEQQQVQRAQQDSRQFAPLYDHYADRIYTYAQRELGDKALAQDIVSATFEKAYANLHKYRWQGVSFGAWLYKIARNEIQMVRRRQKWHLPFIGNWLSSQNVERAVQQQMELDVVRLGMLKLPARDQEILRLHFDESLTHAEIGQVLNCSTRNVAVRLHRALKRLRKQVQKLDNKVVYDVSY